MERSKLNGISVAVFDDYRIVDLHTQGVKSIDTGAAIDERTAFSTASISKVTTALLCLMLARDGVIDLDVPISGYLKSWKLPKSDKPGAAEVTWRQLLTHTAGTSQHGFADFYEGDAVPSLIDSLEGRLPRYDKPIEFLFAPGTNWKYSGGGYVILQLALEDHLGKSLEDLVRERIFAPLGMIDTTMVQPGSEGFLGNAALVHDKDGAVIRTGLPITPQISASGMWSTPTDMAKFMIAFQRALDGREDGVITPSLAREMTDIISLRYVGGMGTPFFRGMGFGNTDWFRHDGSNTGVNVEMLASMKGGYGVVIMGNGDDPNTNPVFATLRRGIIDKMGWRHRQPLDKQPLEPALRDTLVGSYKGLLYNMGFDYRIEQVDGELWIASEFFQHFLGIDRSRMHHLGNDVFAVEDFPNRLRFERSADGTVANVHIFRAGDDSAPVVRSIGELRPGE
nr:serine hydrolase domain-containing protein [Pacificimonas pallii]